MFLLSFLLFAFCFCFCFCICVVKAFSAKWKLPVLIFQTCNNYAGYTCIQLIDEAFSENQCKSKDHYSSSTTRRIIPLHIRGECYNYLQPSDVMVDDQENSFQSKLQDIFVEMQSLFLDNTEIQVLDQIVEIASNPSSITGGASEITPSSFESPFNITDKIHITDEISKGKKNKINNGKYDSEEEEDDKEEDDEEEDDEEEEDDKEEDDEEEDDEEEEDDSKKIKLKKIADTSSFSGDSEVGLGKGAEHEGGSSISSNSSQATNMTNKNHRQCYYSVVMFPEDCIIRTHTVGVSENRKKYFFNVLR